MIKKFLIVSCLILTVFIVFSGQRAWVNSQEAIHQSSTTNDLDTVSESDETNDSNLDTEKNDSFVTLIANQPEKAQKMWLENQQNDQPVDITLVASESALSSSQNWTTILEEELTSLYNGVKLNFTVIQHPDEGTSQDWFEAFEEGTYDFDDQEIVLYELPTLRDNGVLSTDDQVVYMNGFLEEFQSLLPESNLFVLPSQPIYQATVYPEQVKAVRDAVEDFGFTYLDHWTEWPSSDNMELEDYLTEDKDPNSLGHTTWGTYLVNYFSAN
ncbi:hypothetical protein [Jeotgalibacillus marinus]|uniref:SGNH/GDSL hydrolase family protein n=1 Tax=Jeotgalibacillus marinus TaxID=86667 RepID=A0ABV3Q4L3_9BACL